MGGLANDLYKIPMRFLQPHNGLSLSFVCLLYYVWFNIVKFEKRKVWILWYLLECRKLSEQFAAAAAPQDAQGQIHVLPHKRLHRPLCISPFHPSACQRTEDSGLCHISLASFMIMGLDEGTRRKLMTHCNCESARHQSSMMAGKRCTCMLLHCFHFALLETDPFFIMYFF